MSRPKATAASDLGPLVFPLHAGPGLRTYSTSLLYFGRLVTSVPAFLHPGVVATFEAVGDHAHRTRSPLEAAFATARRFWYQGQEAFVRMRPALDDLKPFVTPALLTYAGDPAWYANWTPAMAPARGITRAAMGDNALYLAVAAKEFVWRVFELGVLPDAHPAAVLGELEDRATRLGADGSPEAIAQVLLEDSLLNRFAVALHDTDLRVIVDAGWSVEILSRVDFGPRRSPLDASLPPHGVPETDVLAMHLFDVCMSPWVPPLIPSRSGVIATALESLGSELEAVRAAFRDEARSLLVDRPPMEEVERRVRDRVRRLASEIGAVANLDRASVGRFTRRMLEDRIPWAALCTVVGAPLADLPAEVAAAAGLAFLTSAAANAFKERHEANADRDRSRMRFVYHLAKLDPISVPPTKR